MFDSLQRNAEACMQAGNGGCRLIAAYKCFGERAGVACKGKVVQGTSRVQGAHWGMCLINFA